MLVRIFKNSPFKLKKQKITVFQLELIQSIVAEVNTKTGEAECQFYRRGLCYLEETQRLPEIQLSRFLYCHGELKSTKGQVASLSRPQMSLNAPAHLKQHISPPHQKLHVFLFELALVLSRPGEDKFGGQVFHVYRQPLPNALINLEEIPDGEASGGSSFRGAFTGGNDKGSKLKLRARRKQ